MRIAELIDRHYGKVHTFLRSLSGSAAVADDLTQEAFLRLLKLRVPEGRIQESYLMRVAYTCWIRYSKNLRPMVSLEDIPPVAIYDCPHEKVEKMDDAGRQHEVTRPDGAVTLTEFDDMGRAVLVTENADGGPNTPKRHTAYLYESATGLLTRVAAVRDEHFSGAAAYDAIDWEEDDGTIQVTRYVYGGHLLNADTNGGYSDATTNGGWIAAVHYPDPETGQPSINASIDFAYRFDGQVARRTDARGVTLSYGYDDRDRLASIHADIPANSNGALLDVDTNAALLSFSYTSDDLLSEAVVKTATGEVLNRSAFDYGGLRQLLESTQGDGNLGADRAVEYDWDTESSSNGYRLDAITYPDEQAVTFHYGQAGGIDDVLGRLAEIKVDDASIIAYRHMGMGRKVGTTWGNGVALDFDTGSGGAVTGLDAFGRVLDLTYAGGGPPLVQFQYDYDKGGNRTFARVENGADDRSWRYWYDELDRLVSAARGELNSAGDGFVGPTVPEAQRWFLDDLGNWSGDAPGDAGFERFTDVGGDGAFDDGTDTLEAWERHDTNEVNEIASLATGDDAGTNGVQPFAYDQAGNLIFDGGRFYVYDAWNRVARIHGSGTLSVGTNGLEGAAGAMLSRYEYDALGRRVFTHEQPDSDDAQTTRHVYGSGPEVLAEYDVNTNGQTLERWFVHGTSFPDPLVMVDLTDAGDVPAVGQPGGAEEYLYYLPDALGSVAALTDASGSVVERYAYEPYGRTLVLAADGTPPLYLPPLADSYFHDADLDGDVDDDDYAHITSCLWSSDPLCVFVHDRNGSHRIDALDLGLFAGCYTTNGVPPDAECARPLRAYFDADGDQAIDLWDFYGFQECLGSAEALCLFVYDADGDSQVDLDDYAVLQAALGAPGVARPLAERGSRFGNPLLWTAQRFEPGTGLYHFLARVYDANLGRFLQRDPVGIMDSVGEPYFGPAGSAPSVAAPALAAVSEYLNSFNLYLYVSSNPINGTDPFGRDEYDDLIADLIGHRVATLGYIQDAAIAVGLSMNAALDIAGSLLGIDILQSVMVIAEGRGGFWDAMNIVASATPLIGPSAKAIFKASKWGRKFSRMRKGTSVGYALSDIGRILPYKEAQRITRGQNSEIVAHHILESRHLRNWGRVNEISGAPAVILPRQIHDEITSELRRRLPYGQSYNKPVVWAAYQEVYSKYPEWLPAIERYLR